MRLLLEQGPSFGGLVPSFDIQTAKLTSSTPKLVLELLFVAWILALFLGEVLDFLEYYQDPERLMQERLVELRYQLRVKMLRVNGVVSISQYPNARNFPFPYLLGHVRADGQTCLFGLH